MFHKVAIEQRGPTQMQHPERTTFLELISVSGDVLGVPLVYQWTQGQEAWHAAGASLTGLAAPVIPSGRDTPPALQQPHAHGSTSQEPDQTLLCSLRSPQN